MRSSLWLFAQRNNMLIHFGGTLFWLLLAHLLLVRVPPLMRIIMASIQAVYLVGSAIHHDLFTAHFTVFTPKLFEAVLSPPPAMYRIVGKVVIQVVFLRLVTRFSLLPAVWAVLVTSTCYCIALHVVRQVAVARMTIPATAVPVVLASARDAVQAGRPLNLGHHTVLAWLEVVTGVGDHPHLHRSARTRPAPAPVDGRVAHTTLYGELLDRPVDSDVSTVWTLAKDVCIMILSTHVEELLDLIKSSNPAEYNSVLTNLAADISEATGMDVNVSVDRLRRVVAARSAPVHRLPWLDGIRGVAALVDRVTTNRSVVGSVLSAGLVPRCSNLAAALTAGPAVYAARHLEAAMIEAALLRAASSAVTCLAADMKRVDVGRDRGAGGHAGRTADVVRGLRGVRRLRVAANSMAPLTGYDRVLRDHLRRAETAVEKLR